MSEDFEPCRVDVRLLKAKEASIKLLVEHLSFIRSKTHCGAVFRFGQINIPAEDFQRIASAMGVEAAFPEHVQSTRRTSK